MRSHSMTRLNMCRQEEEPLDDTLKHVSNESQRPLAQHLCFRSKSGASLACEFGKLFSKLASFWIRKTINEAS